MSDNENRRLRTRLIVRLVMWLIRIFVRRTENDTTEEK